jgi:hypothetical protein
MKEPPWSQNVLRAMGTFVALIRKTARPSLVPPYAARALQKLFFAWRINIATACEMDRNGKVKMGKLLFFLPVLKLGKELQNKRKNEKNWVRAAELHDSTKSSGTLGAVAKHLSSRLDRSRC